MAYRTKEVVSNQVQAEVKSLEAQGGLPFAELLSEEVINEMVQRLGIKFRERIFTPTVTLWAFLSQVLSGAHNACGNAVSRVIAYLVAQGKPACSPQTTSYCQARARLPLALYTELARHVGQGLHHQTQQSWLWKGRRVLIADGTTVTMADTEENQEVYPQSSNQKQGLGFPCMRLVVLISLATGAILEAAEGACRGKRTGEQSLFRKMWGVFQPGDVVLADRLYDSYRDIALLKAQGVDSIFGKSHSRRTDFRRGRKLGPKDHIVIWKKPRYDKNRYESREEWEALPDQIEVREVTVKVEPPGFRPKIVTVVTTLLNPQEYSAADLADLFHQRWYCELDLRSIKRVLGMYHLKCRTPEAVRKELWTYILAYNTVRARMAQAAALHNVPPRMLSFQDSQRLIDSFAPYLSITEGTEHERFERELLASIAKAKIVHRPGRKEPRAVKRRSRKYRYLTKPRSQARQELTS